MLDAAIDAAPRFGTGRLSCPNDDGAHVILYFEYPAPAVTEVIDVSLAGCRSLSQTGAVAGRANEVLTAALRPLAPTAFHHYVGR